MQVSLHNGDCIELLKEIPDGSVDLVVTDCPYRIVGGGCTTIPKGNEPSGIFNRRNDFTRQNSKSGKLFDHNDIEFEQWLPDVYRVLRDDSHCYIMVNGRNLKELQIEAEKTGFKYVNLLAWKKNNVTPNKYYMQQLEFILLLRKGKAKNIHNMGTSNCLDVPNIIGKKKHPTEKPVELMRIFIENSSNEGDIILDPFMGCGSTGIACINTNRSFIGIELDEQYFDIAEQRISEAKTMWLDNLLRVETV